MKAIIFLNTTESGTNREILKTAKRLGYKVILFTDTKKQLLERERYNEVDELIYFDYLEYSNIKSYIDDYLIYDYEIVSILSFFDGYVSLASSLADEYTSNILNTRAIEIMEDKLKTRMLFKSESFTPEFSTFDISNKLHFPLIYKESSSTASRGVKRINSEEELSNISTYDAFLEEYIPGQQYLIELLVKDGVPYIIAKIKQIISETEFGTFIVRGYSLDKNFKLNKNEIYMVSKIISTLKLENGHFHIEYKKNKDDVKLIEINPRISGSGMYALLNVALETNYIEDMLKLYLGNDIKVPRIKNSCYAHYFLSNRKGVISKVTGKLRSINRNKIKKIYIRPKSGQSIRVSKNMGDRYGYIIGIGKTAISARRYTESVARNIKFYLIKKSHLELILFILLVIVIVLIECEKSKYSY